MKKIAQSVFWVVFAAYFLSLLYILFLRGIGKTFPYSYSEYLNVMTNFIPFKNIYIYATTPTITLSIIKDAIVNVLGNIITFIPVGLLLPCVFKKFRDFKYYVLFVMISIIAIEALQLFLMLGICDIDDFILNISGCIMGFGIWKIGLIQKMLNKLYLIK